MASTAAEFRSSIQVIRDEAFDYLTYVLDGMQPELEAAILKGDTAAKAAATSLLASWLPDVVAGSQSMAATLAAEWYDELRDASKVAGAFTATAVLPDLGIDSLIGWSFAQASTVTGFTQYLAGGIDLRTTQAANGTITGSNLADPKGRGWARETSPDACPFCRMLAGRGAVYRTRETASFAPHDNCHCVAISLWDGAVDIFTETGGKATPSARGTSAADQARAKQWMKDHGLT